ncbi:hypothetical protein CspeluHIS016_0404020 [Cutaneotrichosporon spelunceum]|uniref:WW domain-containing protein n=1 Tax=Cutaneotrichosporon spelunceum TaxID=1672016 RepID=A0AAD3TVB4_9TREE|nr:hypothetical protein CspeluHIS016_0404020 [Cutaneotrichosporon spelunceum]
MAPKRKSTKATKPPLPDEQPPLLTEQPPLPNEEVPLSNEGPPLPDEQPPLPNEQPPLPNEQPPLPNEQPPASNEAPPLPVETIAQPINSLGEGDDSGDDDDEDEQEEGSGDDKAKSKEKAHPWQAVWAPANNAYYFWNTETDEVTWTNPVALPSEAPPLPNEPPPLPTGPAPSRTGGLPEIDPALAYLLPAEQRDGSTSAMSAAMAARSGRLGADSHYAFAALDEYSRQKRFNEHYFDVDGWEKSKAAEARKRKADQSAGINEDRKITKKDMDRFRAKKAEQKQRRQAWLYD